MRRPLATFVLASSVGFLWVFAVPLFAQPDRRAHVIRAYAAVRGELIGTDLTPTQVVRFETEMEGLKRSKSSSLVVVRSSEALASSEYYRPCFARLPTVTPVDCLPLSTKAR